MNFDGFGVAISAESLYIEGIQSVVVGLDGDTDGLILVALGAYAARCTIIYCRALDMRHMTVLFRMIDCQPDPPCLQVLLFTTEASLPIRASIEPVHRRLCLRQ